MAKRINIKEIVLCISACFKFYVAKQKSHSSDVTKQFSTLLRNFP